jgi:hypothetical protein
MKRLFTLLLSLLAFSISAEELESELGYSKITIDGNGFFMFGQIGSGHTYGRAGANPTNHHWQNFYSGRIDATSQTHNWFKTKISLELSSSWPVLRESTIMKETYRLQYRPVLPQAVGIFDFGNELARWEIETGMMEYAFNPDVKNLGNFLYRSTSYPLNLNTKLDYIYSNLLGMRVQGAFLDNQIKAGSIINSVISQAPFFDWSLVFYGGYTMPNTLVDFQAAFMLDRVWAIDDSLTDCIRLRSTIGDTTLTLRSQKIDVRTTVDIKQLWGAPDYFGKNDAKIYVEGALLGLKDPDYFPGDTNVPNPSLLHRLPLMFGINMPTFKILDLFSFELEYCSYPYAFDWWGYTTAAPSPKPPYPSDTTWRDIYQNKDNIKWTLYLKKSVSNFDIIAFVANDHMRYETYNAESQLFTEQSLRKGKDWHWYIKLQYNL